MIWIVQWRENLLMLQCEWGLDIEYHTFVALDMPHDIVIVAAIVEGVE